MLTVDQINALSKRVEELKGYLGVEQKRMEIAEDEKLTQDPEFWGNPKEAEKVMKRMRTKKSWVQAYDECASSVEDLSVLYEFMKAGEEEESEVDKAFEAAGTALSSLALTAPLHDGINGKTHPLLAPHAAHGGGQGAELTIGSAGGVRLSLGRLVAAAGTLRVSFWARSPQRPMPTR